MSTSTKLSLYYTLIYPKSAIRALTGSHCSIICQEFRYTWFFYVPCRELSYVQLSSSFATFFFFKRIYNWLARNTLHTTYTTRFVTNYGPHFCWTNFKQFHTILCFRLKRSTPFANLEGPSWLSFSYLLNGLKSIKKLFCPLVLNCFNQRTNLGRPPCTWSLWLSVVSSPFTVLIRLYCLLYDTL